MCDIQTQPSPLSSSTDLAHVFMDTDYGTHVIVRSKTSICTPIDLKCFTIVTSPKLLKETAKSIQSSPTHILEASASSLTYLQRQAETPSSEASRPTRVCLGSLTVDSPLPGRTSPLSKPTNSLERFSDDFYSRIAVFMDQEGLEIVEAESCLHGFKQLIKLQVVENSEDETDLTSGSHLKCVRVESGKSDLSMDVKSSKIFQRRSSVTSTPAPKLELPAMSSDDNFMSPKALNHIRHLHEIVGFQAKEKIGSFKSKLKTLLSVDSWEQSEALGGKTPAEFSDCSPASIFEFAQNFDAMSPELTFGKRRNCDLLVQESPLVLNKKESLGLVSAGLPKLKKGNSLREDKGR